MNKTSEALGSIGQCIMSECFSGWQLSLMIGYLSACYSVMNCVIAQKIRLP